MGECYNAVHVTASPVHALLQDCFVCVCVVDGADVSRRREQTFLQNREVGSGGLAALWNQLALHTVVCALMGGLAGYCTWPAESVDLQKFGLVYPRIFYAVRN